MPEPEADNLPAIIEEDVVEVAPAPEPEPEPVERDWLTLSEVEVAVGVSASTIRSWVQSGYIPHMEPSKQGQKQEWHSHHVASLKRIIAVRDAVRSLDDMGKIAAACNVDPARLDGRITMITSGGMRIADEGSKIGTLKFISRDPMVIIPL
jgi:DNA-binding transcriptional MerR regulator